MTEKKDSLPQCNWLNKTMMYQLFIIFNHYLGADNAMIITGKGIRVLVCVTCMYNIIFTAY